MNKRGSSVKAFNYVNKDRLIYYPFIFTPSLAMEASDDPALSSTEMAVNSEENGSLAVAPEAPEAPVGSDPATFTMPQAAEEEEGELPADFERLWKAAHDNPQDFTSWTDLLQYCEQEVCVCYFDLRETEEN